MPTVNYIGIFDCLCAVIFKMLQQVQINKTKHLLEWSLCTQFFISAFIFTVHLYARNFADIKLFMEAQYLKKHTEDSKVRGNINKLNFTVQKNAYCSKTEEGASRLPQKNLVDGLNLFLLIFVVAELPFASILFFPYFAVKYNTIKSLLGEADEALKARAAAERMHPIKESFPRAFGKKTPDRTIKPPVENVSKETVCNMRPFSSQLLEKYIRFIIKNGTTYNFFSC